MSALVRVTAPATDAVPIDQLRAFLRLSDTAEDDALAHALESAWRAAETYTARAFIHQTWRKVMDRWPADGLVTLPRPPVVEVISVALRGPDGQETIIPPADYTADLSTAPGRVVPWGRWPLPEVPIGGIALTFQAGYGASPEAVPAPIRQAIKITAAHLFETREGGGHGALPAEARALLEPFRWRFGL